MPADSRACSWPEKPDEIGRAVPSSRRPNAFKWLWASTRADFAVDLTSWICIFNILEFFWKKLRLRIQRIVRRSLARFDFSPDQPSKTRFNVKTLWTGRFSLKIYY